MATNGKHQEPEELDVEILDGSTAIAALNRSEIDMMIATAKHYPRSIKEFQRKATELATLDEDTAASMEYSVPRDGKRITGPSVRMAEIAVACYQNLRIETNIESIDERHVTVVGTGMDLENNTAVRLRIKRRITGKGGKRFSEDMIVTTSNAAAAIAYREATFKTIPRSFIKPVSMAAKRVALGDAKSLAERREKALDWFNKSGIDRATVLERLGRAGIQEVTLDDLDYLNGVRTAIKDGEVTVEEAFLDQSGDSSAPAPAAGAPVDPLNAALEARKAELKAQAEALKAEASNEPAQAE